MFTHIRNFKFLVSLLFAIAFLVGGFFVTAQTAFAIDPSVVTDVTTLKAAIADPLVTTINFANDINTDEQIFIQRDLTINGQGFSLIKDQTTNLTIDGLKHTIFVSPTGPTGADSNHTETLAVTISNLTVNAGNKSYGVVAYDGATLTLNNVTITNSNGAGLTVNAATVLATTLVTSNNAWGSVNIDYGIQVWAQHNSTFTLSSGTLNESNQIWSDKAHLGGTPTITVNASGYSSYVQASSGVTIWKNSALTNTVLIGNVIYSSLETALTAATSGNTITLTSGSYTTTGQIVIDKNISIVGAGKLSTTIAPGQDTGNTASGDSRGWFLVNAGITFNLSDATLDGTGKNISQAIRTYGNGTINNVAFANITYPDAGAAGAAVYVYSASGQTVNVTNSSFNNIGRVGVANSDTSVATLVITGNTYTGKGLGDHLDYAFEIQHGASATINNNTISANTGTAISDGSTSAGVAVWGDPSTTATFAGNTFSNNTAGIALAIVANDTNPSVTVSAGNTFSSNAVAIDVQNAGATGSPTLSITGSTFTGNTIDLDIPASMSVANISLHESVLSGTSASLVNAGVGTLDASNNYWGAIHPDFAAIISGSGTTTHIPWYFDGTKTVLSSSIDTIFSNISVALASQGVASNIGTVTASNYQSFAGLYFEKRTDIALHSTAIGTLTFSAALDLSSDETKTFLQALGSKMEQGNGRIAFDARTSAIFSATGASIVMYGLPAGITSSQLIVRNDTGTILDPSAIVSSFTQNPTTHAVTFTAAHFTQFDIDTTAPVIAGHADVGPIEATTASGATVTYTAPNATDNIDATAAATCSPASGTAFTVGDTTITCNKTDTAGNAAIATTFVVHVVDTTSVAPASFTAGSPTLSTIALDWTNNELNGSYYTIKRSTSPITDNTTFDAATTLGGAPTVALGVQGYTAKNLSSGTTYYFAIKMTDTRSNVSTLSSASATTASADAPAPTDNTAPAAISDLGLSAGTLPTSQIVLNWSATGDDGSTGIATKYIIKRSSSTITADNFDAATTVFNSLSPKSNGSAETLTASGLLSGTQYCFAIKVQDEVPNTSAISNSLCLTTSANLPTITDVTPTTGQNDGAVSMTITGTNFVSGTTTVRLTNNANTFDFVGTYVSATSITTTIPVGITSGTYGLRVIDGNGTSALFASAYIATNAPTPIPSVTDVVPSTIGTNDANSNIEIYGTSFTGATSAVIDTPAPTTLANFVVVSATKITATIPGTLAAGVYNVKITNVSGTNAVSAVQITVNAPVVINSSTTQDQVTTKPVDLGNTNTIPVQVTLQSDVNNSTLDNNTTIEVVIPPATVVTDANGAAYTGNINPPQLVKPTAEIAAQAGSDAVVITMGNPDEKINFSNDFVVTVTLESTNTTAPLIWYYNPSSGLEIAGKNGVKDGVTYTRGGTVQNTVNNNGTYVYTIGLLLDHMSSYVAGVNPTITTVNPSSAIAGQAVTITGTNFGPGATVKLNETWVAATVNSTTSISITIPFIANGIYTLKVTNTDALFTSTSFTILVNGGSGGYFPSSSGGSSSNVTPTPVISTPTLVVTTPTVPQTTVGQVLGAEAFHFTLVLKNGSKGNEVKELQNFLNNAGYKCGIADGKFGAKTKQALIKWQIANKLKGDGIVGPKVRAILNK